MDALIWILLPGFTALFAGLLAWFIMQARMDVALAQQRETMAESRGALDAERTALDASLPTAMRAAEETAKREALENFLGELRVEQRHYTRENRMLMQNPNLVLQERMYYRNIPLSDWVEHEVTVEDGADMTRLVQDMTIFDKGVVNIAEGPRLIGDGQRPKKAVGLSCRRLLPYLL
jgi:hypothetical protein